MPADRGVLAARCTCAESVLNCCFKRCGILRNTRRLNWYGYFNEACVAGDGFSFRLDCVADVYRSKCKESSMPVPKPVKSCDIFRLSRPETAVTTHVKMNGCPMSRDPRRWYDESQNNDAAVRVHVLSRSLLLRQRYDRGRGARHWYMW